MSNHPVREKQYVSSEKFNWNRLLSLPFAKDIDVDEYSRFMLTRDIGERFPDVSFYQKEIVYGILATKTKGIIIRVGQGSWVDPMFKRNYTEAKKKGLKVGVYFFYDDRVSPQKQWETLVNAMVEVVAEYGLPEMEIWVDWESTYGGEHTGLKNVVAFMQLVEKSFPTKEVGMYTGFWWFIEHSNPVNNFFQYQYLKNKPLWLASYTSDVTKVRIPAPWSTSTWRHWQYGTPSIGISMGVATEEIDMNLYMDETVTWTQRYGETNNDEGDNDMPETITFTAILADGQKSNLRNTYGLDGTLVKEILTGPLTVKGIGQKMQKDGYYWGEVVHVINVNNVLHYKSGWVAFTTAYSSVTWHEAPEPTPTPEPTPVSEIQSIQIINPEKVIITKKDGTTQEL